jgi:hypothetical protein
MTKVENMNEEQLKAVSVVALGILAHCGRKNADIL